MLRPVRLTRNHTVTILGRVAPVSICYVTNFALGVLATARITRLITEDKITEPIRDWVEGTFPGSKVAYLVSCPLCVSVWAAGAISVAPQAAEPLVRMLALSEATIVWKEITDA